jgi:two-component system, sensor histidine kinase and response regulator
LSDDSASPRILIADDEPSVVDMLEGVLIRQGYVVEVACDGDEVLSKVESCHPDLILLDVTMPKKDGYEVLKILRQRKETADIPVMMVTGRGDIPDKITGLHLGAGDYLTKPFNVEELVARVKVHLKGKRGVEEKIKAEKLVALSTMIDGLAHEVRNPLSVIGGFVHILLKKTEPDDPRFQYVLAISREVNRLERMMNDIGNLKGLAIGKKSLVPANILVRDTVQEMSDKLSVRGITLSMDLEPSETEVLADATHFKLGIKKIIQNAIEAMQNGGMLTVRTRLATDGLTICIIDTGPGIKEEHRRFVFDPFFTSKMEGAGLGLTMALKIFQAHGGSISIRSDPGKGAEVIIYLPFSSAQQSS